MSRLSIAALTLLLALSVSVRAGMAELNALMAQKERDVGVLVNSTQQLFAARCSNVNICVANRTQCAQTTCGNNFQQVPGLRCDMSFGSNKSLCGKRCSGLLRSTTSSAVSIAPGFSNSQEAASFVCSTANLTSVFKDLYYNQGVTGFQYVASATGVTRTYPAAAQSAQSCASQDFRKQSWYVTASTGPKDIVFVLDYSGSMNAPDCGPNGMTRLEALKITMNLLLGSLTDADRFNIVIFNIGSRIIGPMHGLLSGSQGNISLVNSIIQPLGTKGATDYAPGFRSAFQIFQDSVASGTSTGCTRILMFLTDGNPTDGNAYVAEIANGQAALGSNPAIIMTYSFSSQANTNRLQTIACQNNGYWAPVTDGAAPNNPVQQFYQWIAQGILTPRPRWTNPQNSSFGQGQVVTVSQPIYDLTYTPKLYLGVAAIDVLVSELLAVASYNDILTALRLRSDTCLDYNLSPCQRQRLRLNQTVPFYCPAPEPAPATCTSVVVVPPSCNTTILTNINQVLCEPYNNYTNSGRNDTSLQCCQELSCLTKSKSISLPTRTATKWQSATDTFTASPSKTSTTTHTTSRTQAVSKSVTTTLTRHLTATATAQLTATENVTVSLMLPRTVSLSPTRTPLQTPSDSVLATHTALVTVSLPTLTQTVSPSVSRARVTVTEVLPRTHSHVPTASLSWQCVSSQAVLEALNISLTVFTLTDQDIISGFNRTAVMTFPAEVMQQRLHLLWDQPLHVPLFAVLRPTSPANSNGFALLPGFIANLTMLLPTNWGRNSSGGGGTVVTLLCPPHSEYNVYAGEAVQLYLNTSLITAGTLCTNDGSTATALGAEVYLLLINTPNSAFIDSGRTLITTTLVAASLAASGLGGLAAPDMQVLLMTAMIPCANTFQRRSFELYRAISPFAISDSFEGVLWGNLLANMAAITLHGVVAIAYSFVKRTSLSQATENVWFPNLSLQMAMMTFPGTAFSSGQVLINPDEKRSAEGVYLAVAMILLFVVGFPCGLLAYIMRNVEASYDRFDYHRWRRDASSLRVRLLSRVLMPVGSWSPANVRHRFGTVITIQSRPEYLWITFPFWSALIVAILGLVNLNNLKQCLVVYAVMLFCHLLLLVVVWYFKPFRSMIEDWFAAIALGLTSVFILLTMINLAYPVSQPAQRAMWVVGIAQVALLIVRMIYHIAHIFIARNLRQHVPHTEIFRWNMGDVDRNSDIDDATEMLAALMKDGSNPFGGADVKDEDIEALLFGERPQDEAEAADSYWSPTALAPTEEADDQNDASLFGARQPIANANDLLTAWKQ